VQDEAHPDAGVLGTGVAVLRRALHPICRVPALDAASVQVYIWPRSRYSH